MSNATKTLTIVFVSLLVLTGLVEWMDGPAASEAFRRNLIALDTAAVEALVIEKPDAPPPIRLARAETTWTVQQGSDGPRYPASRSAVRRALQTLSTLQANALITRQESKHARFQVDSTGTTVTVLNATGDRLARLVMGRTSFTNRQPKTYVRPAGDPGVYEVEAFLPAQLGKDVEGWRDKRVWSLDRSAITRVEFVYPADSSFTIDRVETEAGTAWLARGDTLQTGAVGQLVDEVANLNAAGFAEDRTPEALGTARYTVRIHLQDGTQKVLRLRPSEDGGNYLVAASGYPYVFTVRASTWDDRVLKGRTQLLADSGT